MLIFIDCANLNIRRGRGCIIQYILVISNKVELLIELYNAAGSYQKRTTCFNEYLKEAASGSNDDLSIKRARAILRKGKGIVNLYNDFDLYVNLFRDYLNCFHYDVHNGKGKARMIVEEMHKKQNLFQSQITDLQVKSLEQEHSR